MQVIIMFCIFSLILASYNYIMIYLKYNYITFYQIIRSHEYQILNILINSPETHTKDG